MYARCLNILLAVAILGCPYVRRICALTAVASDTTNVSCCGCCHSSSPADHSPSHDKTPPIPQKQPCQCICGGAVIEAAPQTETPFSVVSWAAPLVIKPTLNCAFQRDIFAFITAPPPTGDAMFEGAVHNQTAAPKSFSFVVEFLNATGAVVGAPQTVEVTDIPAKTGKRFSLTVKGTGIVAYRYKKPGS